MKKQAKKRILISLKDGRPASAYKGLPPEIERYMKEFCSRLKHIPTTYSNGVTA